MSIVWPLRILLPLSVAWLSVAHAEPAARDRVSAEPPAAAALEPQIDPAATAMAIADVPLSPRRIQWYGSASVSFAYRWAFGESMLGAGLAAELGGRNHSFLGGARISLEAGRMLLGLSYQTVSFGPVFYWQPIDRVRVGATVEAGALVLNRITMPGRSMWSVLVGGGVLASADLYRAARGSALHATLSLGLAGLTSAPSPLTVSTAVGLGYRP